MPLTGTQKTAILLLTLGDKFTSEVFKRLDRKEIALVSKAIVELETVPKEMVEEGTPLYKEYVLDEDTFQFGLKKFSAPKNLQFIITMTSHGPWDYQPEDKNEIYSQPKNSIENYFNAIRYLDNSLKNYVEGLPDNTIIFMFGDHVSAQKYENHELGVVPFLVYQKGQVLRFSNKAEQEKALSGELLRSDLIGGIYKYLRNY